MQDTAVCSICEEEKVLDDFYKQKSKRNGRASACKPCTLARFNRTHYRRKYGVEREDILAMLESQGHKCKTCGKSAGEEAMNGQCPTNSRYSTVGLVVDHCHETGKVRGLLCQDCNITLGNAKDNIETLKNMITYLEDSRR